MANSFTYKTPNESELFAFDYTPVLEPGETLVSATCVIVVLNGIDPNPSAMLAGPAVINNPKAVQRVIGGLSEVTYRLEMTATTNYSNIYTVIGDLPVYDASSSLI